MKNLQTAGATKRAPKHRRAKVMGQGRCTPLVREAKIRIQTLARALSHPTEKGKHYGVLTDKFLSVLNALLWQFHNAASGRCFPRTEAIAARAKCCVSTVCNALAALERAKILTWVNRYVRVRGALGVDLFGKPATTPRWRYLRTSNAYEFMDPQKSRGKPPDPSNSKIEEGTPNQVSILSSSLAQKPKAKLLPALAGALSRLEVAVKGAT
jgi:Helix-turn-helix domain